ncbi:MAG: tetratricopeptide repeat protein [Chloroflexi bacterium]|nr:tetratricopeptide repeat protein [Chloroflexota bacterium]
MFDLSMFTRFIPKKVMDEVKDRVVDILIEVSPDDKWRKLVRSFRSDGAFQNAFVEALKRAVERFAEEYEDKDLVEAITQSITFWDLPSVQKALRTVITRPSSYLEPERKILYQSFAEVMPTIPVERVEPAVQYFMRCLAEEVINIPQLFPLYQVQLQKATLEQAREMVLALHDLQLEQRQSMIALLQTIPQNNLLLAAPGGSSNVPEAQKIYHSLPRPDYGTFVGREDELNKLRDKVLASKSKHYAASIDGVGGVGKSTLALEIAYRYLYDKDPRYADDPFSAIIWVSAKQTVLKSKGVVIQKRAVATLDDIIREIALTLNREDILQASDAEKQHELVMEALENQTRPLLIIDNLETVDEAERVTEFIHDLPNQVKVIVTTRERIDTAVAIRLTGLPGMDALTLLHQESEKKQVELLYEDALELFKRTGGIPLALVWSIGLLGLGHSIEHVIAKLGSAKGDLARFCFRASLEKISGRPSHLLLNALALFPHDASRAALMQIAKFGEDVFTFEEAKAELVTLSLINEKSGRYSLLPLTRAYTLDELKQEPEEYNSYYDRFVTFIRAMLSTVSEEYGYWFDTAVLMKEGENIRGLAQEALVQNEYELFFDLLTSLCHYLDVLGAWNEMIDYARKGVALETFAPRRTVLEFLYIYPLGWALAQQGKIDEAKQYLQRALQLAKRSGDKRWECRTQMCLGQAYRKEGDLDKAAKAYQIALSLAESKSEVMDITSELGKLSRDQGKYEEALTQFDAALKTLEGEFEHRVVDSRLHYGILANLGFVTFKLGNIEDARAYLTQSWNFFNERGGKGPGGTALYRLALVEEQAGNKELALHYATKALELLKILGMEPEIPDAEALIRRLTNY